MQSEKKQTKQDKLNLTKQTKTSETICDRLLLCGRLYYYGYVNSNYLYLYSL